MTHDEVLKELKRELGMRRKLYPNWVQQGKLSQQTADHRIDAIEYAIDVLEECKPLDPVQPSLFET